MQMQSKDFDYTGQDIIGIDIHKNFMAKHTASQQPSEKSLRISIFLFAIAKQ